LRNPIRRLSYLLAAPAVLFFALGFIVSAVLMIPALVLLLASALAGIWADITEGKYPWLLPPH